MLCLLAPAGEDLDAVTGRGERRRNLPGSAARAKHHHPRAQWHSTGFLEPPQEAFGVGVVSVQAAVVDADSVARAGGPDLFACLVQQGNYALLVGHGYIPAGIALPDAALDSVFEGLGRGGYEPVLEVEPAFGEGRVVHCR